MATNTIVVSAPDHLGQWSRVADLFITPKRLFHDILRNQSWWLPFLLTVICSYALTFSAAYKVGFHQLTTNIMNADPGTAARMDNESVSQEQKDATISTTETSFKISAFSTPVLVLLYNVVYALALWFGLNAVAGGKAEFGSIFAVLLYADLIQNVRTILATINLFLATEPSTFNIQNAIGSNAGYYLDSSYAGWLRTLLETMDVFTIWYLLVIGLGCSIIAKVSRSASIGVVFGLWLLIVSSRVIWAAI